MLTCMSEEPPEGGQQPGLVTRIWSLRTIVAAAITAVALSGVGGAALAAASDGGSDSSGRTGHPGLGPPGQMQVPPGRVTGRVNGRVNGRGSAGPPSGAPRPFPGT
jgi:hypothetical protein